MILVAVLWPSPALQWGSGCRSHRHAQLVDILAQRREVRQFSCCRTAGSLEVTDRNYGATSSASSRKCYFILLIDIFMTRCSKVEKNKKNQLWMLQHCDKERILFVFSVSFLYADQWSHWFALWGVCAAEAWPVRPHFLFLSSQC